MNWCVYVRICTHKNITKEQAIHSECLTPNEAWGTRQSQFALAHIEIPARNINFIEITMKTIFDGTKTKKKINKQTSANNINYGISEHQPNSKPFNNCNSVLLCTNEWYITSNYMNRTILIIIKHAAVINVDCFRFWCSQTWWQNDLGATT